MNDDDFKAYLEETGGYINVRKLEDGTWAGIFKFMFTWGICTELDMSGYGRRYCYTSESHAIAELGKMRSAGDIPQGFERRMPEPFFFTIVGFEGIPHSIGKCMTEREIIDHANFTHHARSGDMPLDKPSDDALKAALAIINKEGRTLEIFRIMSDADAFLGRAKALGLWDEAKVMVEGMRRKLFL